MDLITSVNEHNKITVTLTRTDDRETTGGVVATLTPTEARVLASHLTSRAELAERRVRLAARTEAPR